jgi:hypothetical protein
MAMVVAIAVAAVCAVGLKLVMGLNATLSI